MKKKPLVFLLSVLHIPYEMEGQEPKNISLDEAQKRDNWKVISMKNDW